MISENVFGRVKGRWRRLMHHLDAKLEDVGDVITVAFAMHNICEWRRVQYNNNWNNETIQKNVMQPKTNSRNNSNEKRMRDALKDFYFNNK